MEAQPVQPSCGENYHCRNDSWLNKYVCIHLLFIFTNSTYYALLCSSTSHLNLKSERRFIRDTNKFYENESFVYGKWIS